MWDALKQITGAFVKIKNNQELTKYSYRLFLNTDRSEMILAG